MAQVPANIVQSRTDFSTVPTSLVVVDNSATLISRAEAQSRPRFLARLKSGLLLRNGQPRHSYELRPDGPPPGQERPPPVDVPGQRLSSGSDVESTPVPSADGEGMAPRPSDRTSAVKYASPRLGSVM